MDNVLLKAPRWSVFPNGERRVTSLRAGKITPIYFNLLGTGDQISLQHNLLLRLAPMLTPAMADIECDVDFFAVPFGVLYGIDIYDDFIVDGNNFGASFPRLEMAMNACLNMFNSGNLIDYFNLPSFLAYYRDYSQVLYCKIQDSDGTVFDFLDWSASWQSCNPVEEVTTSVDMPKFGSLPSEHIILGSYTYNPRPLLHYCLCYWLNGAFDNDTDVQSEYYVRFKQEFPTVDAFVARCGFRTVNALYEAVLPLVISVFFNNERFRQRYGLKASTVDYYTYPAFFTDSYHKIIADWYLNTQVVDPDTYISEHCTKGTNLRFTETDSVVFHLFDRFYPDDYFTGCVPNSQVGSSVQIPADTTVLELSNLTALQRMLLRAGYVGTKRFKDFARGFFGVNPSNQKLMFSEFIGRKTYKVQINDVAQTSESTSQSVLASYSGRGISWGKNGGFKYFADVPTVIVGLASVRAKTLYNGVAEPFAKVGKTSDFILPDLESVGNEAIYLDELTGNPADSETIFAWNRRYYRWTRRPSVVTGAMRTYLESWNIARNTASDKPVYNQDWLTIHPEDGIDNVFGVSDVDNFYCDFRFDVKVSRPLSRYLHLHI